jgi:hypothetical protein
VLILRIEAQVFTRRGTTFENDAWVGKQAQLSCLLNNYTLYPRLDPVLASAETKHLSIKPEPTIPASIVQSDLDPVFWFDPDKLARFEE